MKKVWIPISILLVIFLALFFTTKNDNIEPPIDEVFESIIDSNSTIGEVISEEDGALLIQFEIITPTSNDSANEDTSANINEYYDNISAKTTEFLNFEGYDSAFSDKERQGEDFLNYIFKTDFSVQYENDKIISILRTNSYISGGITPALSTASETFDVKDGSLILLTDIVSDTSILIEKIQQLVASTDGVYANDYYENVNELVETHFDAIHFNITSSYVTESVNEYTLAIHYDEYELGPKAIGPLTFYIQAKEIKEFLTEEYKYLGE